GTILGLHPDDRGKAGNAVESRRWQLASIQVWETANGRPVRKVDVNAEHNDSQMRLSPDGKTVAAWVQRASKGYEGLTFIVTGNEAPLRRELTGGGPGDSRTLHVENNRGAAFVIKDGQLHRWSATNPGVFGPGVPTPFPAMLPGPAADGRSVVSLTNGRVFDTAAWPPRPTGARFVHPALERYRDALLKQSPDGRFTATWTWNNPNGGRLWRLSRPNSRPALSPAEF